LIGDSENGSFELAKVVFLNVDALVMASVECHPMIEGQQCVVNGYSTPNGHMFRDTEALSPPTYLEDNSMDMILNDMKIDELFGHLNIDPLPGNMSWNPEDNHFNPSVPDVIPGGFDFQHGGTAMITELPAMQERRAIDFFGGVDGGHIFHIDEFLDDGVQHQFHESKPSHFPMSI